MCVIRGGQGGSGGRLDRGSELMRISKRTCRKEYLYESMESEAQLPLNMTRLPCSAPPVAAHAMSEVDVYLVDARGDVTIAEKVEAI
jgi:hypothetical protein